MKLKKFIYNNKEGNGIKKLLIIFFICTLPLVAHATNYVFHPLPPPHSAQIDELPEWLRITKPEIIGNEQFVVDVLQMLEYLQDNCPASYMLVVENVRTIRESNQKHSNANVHNGTITLYIRDVQYTASVLVHEATHMWLYRHGYIWYGEDAEAFCNTVQAKFLLRAGNMRYIRWLLIDSLKTRWWEGEDNAFIKYNHIGYIYQI